MAELNIVMVEPEIPQNTGNIARTCAATGARLHLVRPLGFDTSARAVRRAGLDYWHLVDITYYDGLSDFLQKQTGLISIFHQSAPYTFQNQLSGRRFLVLARKRRDYRRNCFSAPGQLCAYSNDRAGAQPEPCELCRGCCL